MKKVTLKFNDSKNECAMYIDGSRVETYTCEEGQIVLSVIKLLNSADAISMNIEYKR